MVVYSKWLSETKKKHAPLWWFQAIFAIDKSEQVTDVLRHSRRIIESYFLVTCQIRVTEAFNLLIDLT